MATLSLSAKNLLDSILASNKARSEGSQMMSVGLYVGIGVAMVAHSALLASLLAWQTPMDWMTALPRHKDPRYIVLYWLYPLLLLNFLLTAGVGFSGWLIVGGLYTLLIFVLGLVGYCMAVRRRKSADPKQQPRTPRTFKARLIAYFRHYNPAKLENVDKLVQQAAGREEDLIKSLVKKYGPEPSDVQKEGVEKEDDAAKLVREPSEVVENAEQSWKHWPEAMGTHQLALVLSMTFLVLGSLLAILLLVYVVEVQEYKLVKRQNMDLNDPLVEEVEFIPQTTAKTLQLMYSWPGLANDMKLAIYVKILTGFCGSNFKKILGPGARGVIKTDWIDKYKINMSQFNPSDYQQYDSVNAWFVRHVLPAVRPIALPNDITVISSPADSRMLIYTNVQNSRIWIKGQYFTVNELIDNQVIDGDPNYFDQATVVIARLAPQDYHRFHSPIKAKIDSARGKEGTYLSVGVDAARSGNYVFYNRRQILILDGGAVMQKVAYVAIGATCVGSVVLSSKVTLGTSFERGEELGYMQFGGSTVIAIFKKGTFLPDCDIVTHSEFPVETYMQMGNRIGRQNSNYLANRCTNV